MCGDPSEDGQVLASDSLFVLRTAVELVSCELCICDVDSNGSVSATDSLAVLRVAVAIEGAVLNCPDF
jgi:hypothetical protein